MSEVGQLALDLELSASWFDASLKSRTTIRHGTRMAIAARCLNTSNDFRSMQGDALLKVVPWSMRMCRGRGHGFQIQ